MLAVLARVVPSSAASQVTPAEAPSRTYRASARLRATASHDVKARAAAFYTALGAKFRSQKFVSA